MWGGLAWPTLSEGYSLLLAEPGAKAIGQTLGEAIQVILAGRTGDPNSMPWISCKPKGECVDEFQLLQIGDVITVTGLAFHVGKNDLFLRDCALLAKAGR